MQKRYLKYVQRNDIKMEIRQMATAFLFNEDKILMMKKAKSRITNLEFWSGLGGHLEPNELNFPRRACIREIYEESGLQEEVIEDLSLRYILLRIKDTEIRQQFVYFGKVRETHFVNSEEGELNWISKDMVFELRLSKIVSFMLEHYFENPGMKDILIGTITTDSNENPQMQWSNLKDPKIF